MTDHREHADHSIDDAAVDDPPTADAVPERPQAEHPRPTRTSAMSVPISDEEQAAVVAGGEATLRPGRRNVDVEGPNSA